MTEEIKFAREYSEQSEDHARNLVDLNETKRVMHERGWKEE